MVNLSYIIVKYVKHNDIELPVILIDEQNEVLNFYQMEDAEFYQKIFQINSDSNHRYEIKHINDKL